MKGVRVDVDKDVVYRFDDDDDRQPNAVSNITTNLPMAGHRVRLTATTGDRILNVCEVQVWGESHVGYHL